MIVGITGTSGVGKSTFMRTFFEALPQSRFLTSTTTRAKRAADTDEKHGEEYECISQEEFAKLEAEEAFLRIFEGYGNKYATRKEYIDEALRTADTYYLAALLIPGAQAFYAHAKEVGLGGETYFLYLDLPGEEKRAWRLHERGETDTKRFEPELEVWRKEAENSGVPFIYLDAENTPENLVREAIETIERQKLL